MSDEAASPNFVMRVPDELEVGTYSNLLVIWSGPHEFTLDFAVTGRAVPTDSGIDVPCVVVSRVKIPHSMAQDVLQALANHVSQFESRAGVIPRLGDDKPTYPPEDLR